MTAAATASSSSSSPEEMCGFLCAVNEIVCLVPNDGSLPRAILSVSKRTAAVAAAADQWSEMASEHSTRAVDDYHRMTIISCRVHQQQQQAALIIASGHTSSFVLLHLLVSTTYCIALLLTDHLTRENRVVCVSGKRQTSREMERNRKRETTLLQPSSLQHFSPLTGKRVIRC